MKSSGVEWIGEIPEDWEVKKVKHSFVRKNEKAMQENPIVLSLARSGVKERDISNNEGQLAESYYNYNPVDVDDLLINPMDLYSGANCSISKVKGVISPAYINLRAKKNVSPVFYDYYFKVQYWMMAFFAHGNGVSFENRWTLNNETLQNYPIVAPSFETQQRIASYLDKKCSKIEETIQNQQQVIEKLKAYKQSLITEAVTGKIKIQNGKVCGKYQSYKESGVEWIGKIPSEWEVGKFGRFAQVKSNLVDPNLYLEYPQIAPDNIGKGSGKLIDWQTVKDSGVISWNHLFFKGQIVYSKIRPTLNKLIIAPFDGLCSADMYPIETNIHKQFFVYMMLSQYFVEQVGLITRDRVKMPKINQNELSGILITVPTKEEQKEISDYLDKKCTAIDTVIEQKQKLIEKLTEYKKSLIYECVTGKKEI